VERRAAGDVRVADDEATRESPAPTSDKARTLLLEFLPPTRREIAVEIETVPWSLDPGVWPSKPS
jgi:hypothetical protein